MDYFEFYSLEPSFFLDESELKKRFYSKMRILHPDMNMGATVDEKHDILEQSSYNNKAYKTLKDFHARLKYIVNLNSDSDKKATMSQMFLMEMMDINDEIMELQMDENKDTAIKLKTRLLEQLSTSESKIKASLKESKDLNSDAIIKQAQEYLLQRNYINRLINNVEKVISN